MFFLLWYFFCCSYFFMSVIFFHIHTFLLVCLNYPLQLIFNLSSFLFAVLRSSPSWTWHLHKMLNWWTATLPHRYVVWPLNACVFMHNASLCKTMSESYLSNHLFLCSPAKSFSADKPRSFFQPHRQTVRLWLPQGHRKRQLWQGSSGPPPEWWEVLRGQGAAKESHLEEKRGMASYKPIHFSLHCLYRHPEVCSTSYHDF